MAERTAPADPNPETGQETQQGLEWRVAEDSGDAAAVIIHNDDITPYDFVVAVLRAIFRLPAPEAERITWQAHTRGLAHVMTLAREEAKYRVGKAHGLARQSGYPLMFTIESA